MNSRTSLYGALQDSIVDAELLLNAMEPLEFAAHSHLIAATELKEIVLFIARLIIMNLQKVTDNETIQGRCPIKSGSI